MKQNTEYSRQKAEAPTRDHRNFVDAVGSRAVNAEDARTAFYSLVRDVETFGSRIRVFCCGTANADSAIGVFASDDEVARQTR